MPNAPLRLKPKTPTYRLISPVSIWRYYQQRSYGRVPLLLLALSSPSDRLLAESSDPLIQHLGTGSMIASNACASQPHDR